MWDFAEVLIGPWNHDRPHDAPHYYSICLQYPDTKLLYVETVNFSTFIIQFEIL